MKRSPLPRRRKPLKKVNRQRKQSEWQRCYGSKARVTWVKQQPSVISGLGPCENVHVRNGGAGRKADYVWIVPLTHNEHAHLHQIGQPAFEARNCINLEAHAAALEARWRAAAPTEE